MQFAVRPVLLRCGGAVCKKYCPLICAVVVLNCTEAAALADEAEIAQLHERVRRLRYEFLKVQAEGDALDLERKALAGLDHAGALPAVMDADHPGVRETVHRVLAAAEMLQKPTRDRTEAFARLARVLQPESESALQRWQDLWRKLTDACEPPGIGPGGGEGGTGPNPIGWNMVDRFTAETVLLLCLVWWACWLAARYRLRTDWRRWRRTHSVAETALCRVVNGVTLVALAALFVGALAVSRLQPSPISEPLEGAQARLAVALRQTADSLEAKRLGLGGPNQKAAADIDKLRQQALARWQSDGPQPLGLDHEFREQQSRAFGEFHKLLATAQEVVRLDEESRRFEEAIARAQEAVTARAEAHWRRRAPGLAILLLSAAVLLAWLSYFGFLWFRRVWRRRICPRCQSSRRMQAVRNPTTGERELKCRATDQAGRPSCPYQYPYNYSAMPHLRMGVIGKPKSGKTFWLAAVNSLAEGWRIPFLKGVGDTTGNTLARANSKRLLAGKRDDIDPTKADEFDPCLYHFRDAEGRDVAIHLVDLSGEVLERARPEFYYRALRMDGLLFFLDAIQDHEGLQKLQLQVQMLTKSAVNLRAARGWLTRPQICMPMAVCLSKLDLLHLTGLRFLKDPQAWADELRGISASQPLGLVRLRSLKVRSALPAILMTDELSTGVIAGMDENFGENYRWFPMTVYGLNNIGHPGEPRLDDMFGIAEPLLWLLHQCGCETLRSANSSQR